MSLNFETLTGFTYRGLAPHKFTPMPGVHKSLQPTAQKRAAADLTVGQIERNIMQILGYIGYATLIFMAITWTLGVRLRLGLGIHTILGALFFLVSAIAVGVSGINKLHSWWLLPAGFLFIFLTVAILARRVPILCPLVKLIASVYA
jgi:hypothetical protein